MRRRTTLLLALAALAVLAAAVVAPAEARSSKRRPVITRVTPMRLHLGAKVTIRGRGFSSRRSRNTVIFRASNGRAAFVKPRRASRHKLVVVVPGSVERLLSSSRSTTRFRLRVLARTFSKWTPRRLSPVVVGTAAPTGPGGSGGSKGTVTPAAPTPTTPPPPADCDHDGLPNTQDSDDDNDLLSDATEATLHTNPCSKDSDGDGVEDGYEERSAIDLNHYPGTPPLPYPGKRPYPNALDPSDGSTDYDGDGLTLRDESTLWLRYGGHHFPLNYSDGLQKTAPVPAPASPALLAYASDIDGDGVLSDDEKDADNDGLTNWDETHGRMSPAWWRAQYDGANGPKETPYPVSLAGTSFVDADTDGDGVKDGADDNDFDGLSNAFEVRRPDDWATTYVSAGHAGTNAWARVQPFNPCKPIYSQRCHTHPPFGYYAPGEDWAAPQPAPDPSTAPATPAG